MIRIMSLPRTNEPMTARPAARDADGRVGQKPITILIIEDDATTRMALACMVADERYQIVLATSAEDALERLPAIDPDVILCDFMLEGMNGRELCQGLKASARWRYVPVIVVTRVDAVQIVADLLKSGADDVLIKPVRGEELRARVIAALRTRYQYLQLGRPLPRPVWSYEDKAAATEGSPRRALSVYA